MYPLDKNWLNQLVAQGTINLSQAGKVLKEYSRTGEGLENILLKMKVISEQQLYSLLSKEWNVAYIGLDKFFVDTKILKLVPEAMAREYKLMPLFKIKDRLHVAISDPMNIDALDAIARKADCNVDAILASPTDIKQAITKFYRGTTEDSMGELLEVIEVEQKRAEEQIKEMDAKSIQKIADEAPLIKLVNLIIVNAIHEQASDIHIEPAKERVRVRYRIDGILQESQSLPKHLQFPIVSRIKVMSGLDIVETRRPQDGRIGIRLKDKEVDLRISIFPTSLGEKIVMRILDKSRGLPATEELGFCANDLSRFKELIHRPNGIILITGPTGSGKTSTLYVALREINSPQINITTLEDPVEYQLDGINQAQINARFGLNFAGGLRAILRQDPNVVLVGEVRDTETAEIAIRASLTGHLVFTTLHTNDAPNAITRLIDMEIEPFLISSSLLGVSAQRLVRRICPNCQAVYRPSQELFDYIEMESTDLKIEFRKGKGCANCRHTGYKGRLGIFELLVTNDQIRSLILNKGSVDQIKQAAIDQGMSTLFQDGLEKVRLGMTTIEELISITRK